MQILCDTFGVCPVWAFLFGEGYAAGPQTNFWEQGYRGPQLFNLQRFFGYGVLRLIWVIPHENKNSHKNTSKLQLVV